MACRAVSVFTALGMLLLVVAQSPLARGTATEASTVSRVRKFPSAVARAITDAASRVYSSFPGVRATRNFGRFYCRGTVGEAPSKICSKLVQNLGFECKDYVTKTQDGFTLGLQRITKPSDEHTGATSAETPDGSQARTRASGTPHSRETQKEAHSRFPQQSGGARNLLMSSPGDERETATWHDVGGKRGGMRAQFRRLLGGLKSADLRLVGWGKDQESRLERRRLTPTKDADKCATSAYDGGNDAVPVLLQHGLLVAAESWLLSDPRLTSLPFQLAAAGYDTWLGNSRCSPWVADGEKDDWSGVRRVKDALPQPFNRKADWDWSWDEMARYDLPAQVDKILSVTGSSFVLYVGHSQGTLTFLSSLAMGWMPHQHIKGAYLLSPISFLRNLKAPFVRRAAELNFDKLVSDTGLHHFSFHNEIGQRVLGEVCAQQDINCTSLQDAITGPNCCVDMHRAEELLPWFPLSTSVKNMAHFAQAVRTGLWRMFDHGWLNLIVYGSVEPPTYEPSKIPDIPMTFAYGDKDTLSVVQDVNDLVTQLKFKPRVFEMPMFAHLDFILGSTWEYNNVLYEDVVSYFDSIIGSGDSN